MSGADQETRGIVFDIKRYTLHDGPGIRVSVHLKGCPLACWWCHNPESQSFEPQLLFRPERCIRCAACAGLGDAGSAEVCPSGARELCGHSMTVSEVMREVQKERMFFEQSGGGVTLSGGEPLAQPDFALAILEACKRGEIHTCIDTSGFAAPDVILKSVPLTDLYLYDLKHMDPEKHREYTGIDNTIILENLLRLGEAGAAINVRMPFIPGINTDEANLRAMAEFVSRVKGVTGINLLPYHSAAEDKHSRWGMAYKLKAKNIYAPTENALRKAAEIIEGYGIKTTIGG